MSTGTKLLVMSDLHLVDEGEEIIGLDPAARFREVLDHALSHHRDADRILLTGDLTHQGHTSQYQRLRQIMADVTMPVSYLLGNHDRRDAFQNVFGGTGFVQEVHEFGRKQVICLDTLDGPPYEPGHHAGALCEARLTWLQQQLSNATGPVVIFMHHPPFDCGFDGMDAIKLACAEKFLDLITTHSHNVQLVCGHIHRTISGHIRGVPFAVFKSPCHQMPMVLGEGKSTLSINEPGGYGIILLTAEGVVVHNQDVGLSGGDLPLHDAGSA